MTGKMKFREVETAIGPIDRDELDAGDRVEGNEKPYIMQSPCREFLATNLQTGENASLQYATLYRIRMTGEENGKLTWKRICPEPKPVGWDELEDGEPFVTSGGWLCRRHKEDELRHGGCEPVHSIGLSFPSTWSGSALRDSTIYRVEFCGFDTTTGEILWRRI